MREFVYKPDCLRQVDSSSEHAGAEATGSGRKCDEAGQFDPRPASNQTACEDLRKAYSSITAVSPEARPDVSSDGIKDKFMKYLRVLPQSCTNKQTLHFCGLKWGWEEALWVFCFLSLKTLCEVKNSVESRFDCRVPFEILDQWLNQVPEIDLDKLCLSWSRLWFQLICWVCIWKKQINKNTFSASQGFFLLYYLKKRRNISCEKSRSRLWWMIHIYI